MATKKTVQSNTGRSADISVLKNPRITEKAARGGEHSIYLFDVATTATKSEIAKAFQVIYKQKAIKVNTVTVARKSYFKKGRLGFGTKGKKAYVHISKGTKIDIG